MQPDFNPEIIKSPWVAGAMGALVALRGVPGITWLERFFNLICGAIIAGYMSPAVADYLGLVKAETHYAAAFLMGLFGLNLIAAIVEAIRTADLGKALPWKK